MADARQSGRVPHKMKLTVSCPKIFCVLSKKKKKAQKSNSHDFMQVIFRKIKYKNEAVCERTQIQGKISIHMTYYEQELCFPSRPQLQNYKNQS